MTESTSTQTLEPVAPVIGAEVDPGFNRAIAEGFLSRAEARSRGNRETYAAEIARRHGLSIAVALMVADDRLSSEEALARLGTAVDGVLACETPEPEAAGSDRSFWWLAGLLLLALCALPVLAHQRHRLFGGDGVPQEAGRPGNSRESIVLAVGEPVVERKPGGAVSRITAAHPRSVLLAFCKASAIPGSRTPLRVVPAADGWIGHYAESGRARTITIDPDGAGAYATSGR